MSIRKPWFRPSRPIMGALEAVVGFGMLGFLQIVRLKPETYGDWWKPLAQAVELIQQESLYGWGALTLLAVLSWLLRRRDSWVHDKIQTLLDRLQESAYNPHFEMDVKDNHRVTLFRYRRCFWGAKSLFLDKRLWGVGRRPWNGWLVPYQRSGITSQKTKAIFMAPDSGHKAEGVAGRAWAMKNLLVVPDLPNLDAEASEQDVQLYADQTFCPVDIVKAYLKAGKPLPRSIGAAPIEVSHQLWGLVVFDSREPNGVTTELVNKYPLLFKSISLFLERAK